ncbi:MBL fold metallo-hydrolase [candidate division KSB1 bacterium]
MKRLFAASIFLMVIFVLSAVQPCPAQGTEDLLDDLKITVIYDNYLAAEGLKTDWGFSCLIEGGEKTILFDTGTKGDILMHNMKALKIDPKKVDVVIISHDHGDHYGGLPAFLNEKSDVTVYMLKSFSQGTKNIVINAGAELIEVTESVKVCNGIYITGEIKGPANEEGIILRTSKGSIILTGCAHPGIDKIVKASKNLIDDKILYVMGGFHLLQTPKESVEKIISSFRDMGVKYVSATHCTGDNSIKLFRDAFKENFIPVGAGKILTLSDF